MIILKQSELKGRKKKGAKLMWTNWIFEEADYHSNNNIDIVLSEVNDIDRLQWVFYNQVLFLT